MTDWDDQDAPPAEDDGVLEPSDSLLTDRLDDDPLDTGIVTANRYRASLAFGTTAAEARRGESLDQLLAEEEPDEPAESVDDRWADGPSPRAGRLVRDSSDTIGFDLGPDGGAASAEEAAVHLTDADRDAAAVLDDGGPDETLNEAVGYAVLDDLGDAGHDEYR
ncbi:hypothetical protein CFP65_7630 [Kitasatospora sp. MMS16-BH015]|uniref:DUF5709 domain-containing protein n=1 Tax=Kitasatospora sp. MMS16-BH015 TaxID=2018025 RepID=UPI000CA2C932|nr:DUF5709 domain-containing protein [Kitasatospora sp. MMS16-BH015]AUG82201.1 hypothetical protein CFP65_7630 [Kitasatospora sp. MMS16-BH015]